MQTAKWWTGTKEAVFENIEIPERFGPFEVVVDERMVKNYAFAQDDASWLVDEHGRPAAHPAVLSNELLFLFYSVYDGNTAQGLHTHEDLSFHSLIRIGEKVTLSGQYVATFTRRGKGYVVMEAEARGDDGRLLIRHRGTEIMRVRAADVVGRATASRPSRVVTGEQLDVEPASKASFDLAERTPIVPVTKQISQEQMYVFSWGGRGFSNIHTDLAGARRSGMDRTVAQAMQQVGYLAQMLTAFHGAAWITDGHLSVKFVHPFYVEDEVTAQGAVLGSVDHEGRRHLESEVWVENQHGEKTAVGWAHAPA
ncbi:hypothetical protein MOQ72_13435 [Saccharopolyspora sp. K220]|uniref:MaoC/PaaZ C-terminal domain-containing protein n=1 Tax=Saccharopolyspora soli TaxID=2926618 RepID=UPI001F563790|nr:MaoC/PaaZ C-terminal domain-containing protein [Saccharopolyspora soli]MCI2418435.1 hypothetical protein [Saccharopolyspora soli]